MHRDVLLTPRLHLGRHFHNIYPDGHPTAVNPGVTCDLLLAFKVHKSSRADWIHEGLVRKWKTLNQSVRRAINDCRMSRLCCASPAIGRSAPGADPVLWEY